MNGGRVPGSVCCTVDNFMITKLSQYVQLLSLATINGFIFQLVKQWSTLFTLYNMTKGVKLRKGFPVWWDTCFPVRLFPIPFFT